MTHFGEHVSFIWSIAEILRGSYKQSEYGRVVRLFTVLRCLDCVLAPTRDKVQEQLKNLYVSPRSLDEIDTEMANSRVKSGDILLNVTGASIGRTCLVPDKIQKANVNQHVCIIRVSHELQEYISFCMKSRMIKSQIDFVQNGAAREGLNFEQISNIRIPIPPKLGRESILEHIRSNLKKFEELIAKVKISVDLIKERRTALISAAVTGKIDVRHIING